MRRRGRCRHLVEGLLDLAAGYFAQNNTFSAIRDSGRVSVRINLSIQHCFNR